MSEIVSAGGAPKPMGAYPHARRVGDLLFLSGMGPRSPETDEIPGLVLGKNGEILEYDMAAQCHAVFANVRSVLEAAGLGWGDLVDVTVFLTDMKSDFTTFNEIYAEYFSVNQPCRTTVEISSLPTPIAIELKCIAATGDHGDPT